MNRQDQIRKYEVNPDVSVLIVGGGVNGIGTFRDLALQGVDVLLVEKSDFCSGASAASSHMLHGGIRYLENGEFRLVREALKERNLLLHNAPHYARPLPTTIPIFGWFSGILNAPLKFLQLLNKPSERGALVIKMGLVLYDWFTRSDKTMPNHVFRLYANAIARHPHINRDIICTATYYDAQMPSPERICMEMISDAEEINPDAIALNYVSLAGGQGNTVILRDEVSGRNIEVRPKLVINAAGPWIDFANEAIYERTEFIGGTKGSHLILDHPELYEACAGTEMFFENHDGRIVLILPFVDGRVMVGTTDIRVDDPENVVCTEDEIDYILGMIPRVFPKITVERSHIVFQFSGVRPLPSSVSSFTGQISRDHSIKVTEPGTNRPYPIYSLIGGKWTSMRAFSEQTTDKALGFLNRKRKISTEHLPFGGGKLYPQSEAEQQAWIENVSSETGLTVERVSTLFERYGTGASNIARFISQAKDVPLEHKPDYSQREILFVAQSEKIVHLDDLVLRRSLLAMCGHLTVELVAELAGVLGGALGWSAKQRRAEIERTHNTLQQKHGVMLSHAATVG